MKKLNITLLFALYALTGLAQQARLVAVSDPMPKFSKGSLQNYIQRTVVYPLSLKQQKIEGKVVIAFIVETDGTVSSVQVKQKAHPLLDEAAVTCIKNLPVFSPGSLQGKPVRVQMYMPVVFSLKPLPELKEEPIREELIETSDVIIVEDDPIGMDNDTIAPPLEPPPLPTGPGLVEIPTQEVYTFAEQMPEFNGDLNKYIHQYLVYPKQAREQGLEGKVIVEFIIEKDGRVTHANILKKGGSGFDEEALRLVKNMPNWKPGKQNGKPVSIKYFLPINFKLN